MTLDSWSDGVPKQRILEFLEASKEVPVEHRLAVFDNDGTLWCEKPQYVQLMFFVTELHKAVAEKPELGEREEYRALLTGDQAAMAELGLPRLAIALVELFDGLEPSAFTDTVRRFFAAATHPEKGVPYPGMRYQPMLELVAALEAHDFAVCIVTGGGTEFLRAMSHELYGIPPERVVGTLVSYDFQRRDGHPVLVRAADTVLEANEGPTKVTNMQTALGRQPIFAAGNSAGDTEMLEYAMASEYPSLSILIDHDDAEREYAYESVAGSFEATESITDTAVRLGWTIVSMARDWTRVFPG